MDILDESCWRNSVQNLGPCAFLGCRLQSYRGMSETPQVSRGGEPRGWGMRRWWPLPPVGETSCGPPGFFLGFSSTFTRLGSRLKTIPTFRWEASFYQVHFGNFQNCDKSYFNFLTY